MRRKSVGGQENKNLLVWAEKVLGPVQIESARKPQCLSCTVPAYRLPLGVSSRAALLMHCNLISL